MIDNSDRRLDADFSEISISRHIDRSGEGVYRLNGARCRLVDVLEVLSDTGLGKEMHSVISQGRVESIVHSKPADRTVLIEEAAGLTKHRKRRHRAELKLNRTQDNLDRALDVEREARSHLRPLKRQAEAAELHARLERQSLETRAARWWPTPCAPCARSWPRESAAAGRARKARDEVDASLMEVAHAREATERRLTDHGRERDRLAGRAFAARTAVDRISLRLESVSGGAQALPAGSSARSARSGPCARRRPASSSPTPGWPNWRPSWRAWNATVPRAWMQSLPGSSPSAPRRSAVRVSWAGRSRRARPNWRPLRVRRRRRAHAAAPPRRRSRRPPAPALGRPCASRRRGSASASPVPTRAPARWPRASTSRRATRRPCRPRSAACCAHASCRASRRGPPPWQARAMRARAHSCARPRKPTTPARLPSRVQSD